MAHRTSLSLQYRQGSGSKHITDLRVSCLLKLAADSMQNTAQLLILLVCNRMELDFSTVVHKHGSRPSSAGALLEP